VKVKNFQRNYLVSEKFLTKFLYFFESENFQNLKMIESKKISTEITESEKYFTKIFVFRPKSDNFRNLKVIPKPKSENFQGKYLESEKFFTKLLYFS
jgi:hypothetical protein